MPERLRLSRRPGWRKPQGAVVVSRPSKFGNPFTVADCLDEDPTQTRTEAQARCVRLFQDWLDGEYVASGLELQQRRDWILEHVGELAGKDLACWCKIGEPCHADVLLATAARTAQGTHGAGHEDGDAS